MPMQRASFTALLFGAASLFAAQPGRVTQGMLLIRDPRGAAPECPLKRTDVRASISGPLARVTVTQEFKNEATDTIEAVYVFPLPHQAAVNNMNLLVGDRVVRGTIRTRDEARAVYDAARNAGRTAALLDQERPNIFTQSVANIRPGENVRIEISYVERLGYEGGTYEFVFPMVVGPKYNPAGTPDAHRISPPVAPPATRAGHDLTLSVTLDAGVSVDWLASPSHEIITERPAPSRAAVRLRQKAVIPNKDFVLRYDVAGNRIQDAVLTHRSERGGFFALMLQPPERVAPAEIRPKEIVFVLDTSGSMSGFPMEKAKEAMALTLSNLNPSDTFNLITFAGDTHILFPGPVPASADNLARAKQFLRSRHGSGGTEMMKAVRAALDPSAARDAIRVVCFMTDGYVGNENEIIAEVRAHPNARVFSFGIGNSVNRFLLDKMAEAGRGEVEYVRLSDDGSAAAKRFHERVHNPVLTDITVEWNGLAVTDVLPARISDLFSAKPLVVTGRYATPGKGTLRVRGKLGNAPFVRDVPVELPASAPQHEVLPVLWARTRVESLMHDPGSEAEITQLGLDYRLMTPYTSFVAVEETVVTEGGKPRKVEVPVEIPDGVSYDGIFGDQASPAPMAMIAPASLPFAGGAVKMRVAAEAWQPPVQRAPVKIAPALRTMAGVVRVQIWLTDTQPATLAALKSLGFELTGSTQTAKLVIGRVDAVKLARIAALTAVRWIAPAP
jgi:Ca-activated chloride channel family protein